MDIFEKYAEKKKQVAVLEAEIKELQPQIAEELINRSLPNLEFKFGKFTLATRKNWTYSIEIQAAEALLKNQKKIEELDGTAKAEETQYLVFKSV